MCAPLALALDPRLSVSQYIHTSWLQTEGALVPEIIAMTQTADGYLWFGTPQGLWRFDGLRLVRWTPAPGQQLDDLIFSVAPSPTGGLWLGTAHGLRRLENNRLTDYSGRFGLPTGYVASLWQSPAGPLWMASVQNGVPGATVFDGRAVNLLPNSQVRVIAPDQNGILWAATPDQAYVCAPSGGAYSCLPKTFDFEAETAGAQPVLDRRKLRCILHDRDGNLWLGTEGDGLYLVRQGKVERFTRRDGLSGDFVETLVEDREGNIWVGTTYGFDRFREPTITRWSTAQGLSGDLVIAALPTRSGDVWVSSVNRKLDRMRNGAVQHVNLEQGEIQALFEDDLGAVWIGASHAVLRAEGDRIQKAPTASGTAIDHIFAITQGTHGAIWMAYGENGLAVVRNGVIVRAAIPGLAPDAIYQLASTRAGDLWIGYFGGGVSVVSQGVVRRFDAKSGIAGGAVQAIYEDHLGSVWVGAQEGLSRYRTGKWTTWTVRDGLPAGGIQGVIEDRLQRFWLLTPEGLALLHDDVAVNSPPKLSLTLYGPGDLIRMRPRAGRVNPRIAIAPDGRIWFPTEDGLASLDPSSIHVNRVAPPVEIEDLLVDGKHIATPVPGTDIRGRSVEVEYTALSLSLPETVRFRYMLEPVNKAWVEGGATRRMAFASLSPGRYRFRVTACNSDGAWNPAGAMLSFVIEPRVYQTWWFLVLLVASVGLAGLGFHRARTRMLRSRFQLILQERGRLARDMHDTLLQGFAGAVYQMEAAARLIAKAPEQGQERMSKALEQADQSMAEARQMLSSLRLSALDNRTLPEALRATGEQIVDGGSIRFECSVRGRPRELPYDAQINLYIIAREAISNAATHAEPSYISVELAYADAVSLTVRDTGKGFDPEAAESRPDHWGLSGMKERACQIGATLTIQSKPGQGTTVEVLFSEPRL